MTSRVRCRRLALTAALAMSATIGAVESTASANRAAHTTIGAVASTASANRAAHTTIVVGSFGHDGIVRVLRHPHRFKVESEDSFVLFSELRWRRWGDRRARAAGIAKTCDYEGTCSSHRTVLIAGNRSRCLDDFAYRRLTASAIPLYGRGPFELPVEPVGCVRE